MTPAPARVPEAERPAALERLLTLSVAEHDATARAALDDAEAALAAPTDLAGAASAAPRWAAWRHALAARRSLAEDDAAGTAAAVTAARRALACCPPSAESALTLAYLADVAVSAGHVEAAMVLAVDASLLVEHLRTPSRALRRAHAWLSRTLGGLDLEELAAAHAVRGRQVATALPDLADHWSALLLCAQQHAELAQTVRRRGDGDRARELAEVAIEAATAARELDREPEPAELDLLDVVQAWAMACRDDLESALGPMRRVRRRVQADGGVWLRGFADLALARLLTRLGERRGDPRRNEEAVGLLVEAAGAFAATADHRRYRQCLLELGRSAADLGRPAEALHWLEAYRADAGRTHARGRELWAEMFVRRSRLREAERQAAVLRRHALEDPLTGLGNRSGAEHRMGGLPFGDEPRALAVVDVDRFKEVNDTASHSVGDVVLRRVADLLREHSRTADEVYRWAGDEFVVLLPDTGEAQAVLVMERLRAAVAGADWGDLPLPAPVTVSIGVAATGAEGPAGWQALFDAADLHLFAAKRGGRNQVRAPGGGPPDDGDAP